MRPQARFIGKLTDALPWVSDDHGLTPAAYAYAYAVIGSSECMSEAYDTTALAMDEAYRAQMTESGLDPDDVEVDMVGEPDFEATGTDVADLDGYAFRVEGDTPSCEVAPDAYRTPTPVDAESQ